MTTINFSKWLAISVIALAVANCGKDDSNDEPNILEQLIKEIDGVNLNQSEAKKHGYMVIKSGENLPWLFLIETAQKSDEQNVWIDINNNGIKDANEQIKEFGKEFTLSKTSHKVAVYGKITRFECHQTGVYYIDVIENEVLEKLYLKEFKSGGIYDIRAIRNKNLKELHLLGRAFTEEELTTLLNRLPKRDDSQGGKLYVSDLKKNNFTEEQIKKADEKKWTLFKVKADKTIEQINGIQEKEYTLYGANNKEMTKKLIVMSPYIIPLVENLKSEKIYFVITEKGKNEFIRDFKITAPENVKIIDNQGIEVPTLSPGSYPITIKATINGKPFEKKIHYKGYSLKVIE